MGAGAKVLGPIHLHDGARIGSNAVVVKDVAAGESVIGVPGRVVKNAQTEDQKQKQKLAQEVGFDAYGTSSETLDPVAAAIHGLIEHIHALDKRIDAMSDTIEQLGGELPNVAMPELNDCELRDELVEKEESNKSE